MSAPARVRLVYVGHAHELVAGSVKGGHLRTLGPASQALLAPDGLRVGAIVVSPGAAPTLTTYATAGRRRRAHAVMRFEASEWSRGGIRLLAWSPDSHLLALTATRLLAGGEQPELLVVNASSGAVATIAAGNFLGASFAPALPDRLVYARATVDQLDAGRVLLFTADADGRHQRAITHAGLAADPSWGARGIVFARLEQLGTHTRSPRYQLWEVQPAGSGLHQLTHIVAGPPVRGAATSPLSISASGTRVVANFFSPTLATIETWTVGLAHTHPAVRRLVLHGRQLIAQGISRDGRTLLVSGTRGATQPLESLRWNGSRAHPLAPDGVDPSWNR